MQWSLDKSHEYINLLVVHRQPISHACLIGSGMIQHGTTCYRYVMTHASFQHLSNFFITICLVQYMNVLM